MQLYCPWVLLRLAAGFHWNFLVHLTIVYPTIRNSCERFRSFSKHFWCQKVGKGVRKLPRKSKAEAINLPANVKSLISFSILDNVFQPLGNDLFSSRNQCHSMYFTYNLRSGVLFIWKQRKTGNTWLQVTLHLSLFFLTEDPCENEPCKHNGYCVQLKGKNPGYRCECHGTGYFGPRCHESKYSVVAKTNQHLS